MSGTSVYDLAHLQQWIGRSEESTCVLAHSSVAALAATLDRPKAPREGDPLPLLWHWIFFQPAARHSELAPDGHPQRGDFLPPAPLPRRMWAGGALRFSPEASLTIGATATRRSRIASVDAKSGKSGPLLFVTLEHSFFEEQGCAALTERHDIVYRGPPPARDVVAASVPSIPRGPAQWRREMLASSTLLFRYSALTFNAHRIHYDQPYSTTVEGYPGLVVHGPLIPTLCMELLLSKLPQARVVTFDYRAIAPLFDTTPFSVCGRSPGTGVELWAEHATGDLAMTANATL